MFIKHQNVIMSNLHKRTKMLICWIPLTGEFLTGLPQ